MLKGKYILFNLLSDCSLFYLQYNKVANLFDNLGSELCFSETIQPVFGSNRMVQSNSCWDGSALVSP
ncbi:hypothetical protein ACTXT7_001819 [Hymenolepis weldensis]